MSEILWSLRARSLSKARKALVNEEPEGLHNFRVALRRAEATAAALGKKTIERKARSLVRSLSPLRQLEVNRHLLLRLRAAHAILILPGFPVSKPRQPRERNL